MNTFKYSLIYLGLGLIIFLLSFLVYIRISEWLDLYMQSQMEDKNPSFIKPSIEIPKIDYVNAEGKG